jgi:hypothetical protein
MSLISRVSGWSFRIPRKFLIPFSLCWVSLNTLFYPVVSELAPILLLDTQYWGQNLPNHPSLVIT